MGISWNETRELAKGNPYAELCVRILDGIMDDYAREEDRYIELDVRQDMKHDIGVYRRELALLLEGK